MHIYKFKLDKQYQKKILCVPSFECCNKDWHSKDIQEILN